MNKRNYSRSKRNTTSSSERRSFSRNRGKHLSQPHQSSGRERYKAHGRNKNIGRASGWLIGGGIGFALIVTVIWLLFRGLTGGTESAPLVSAATATAVSSYNFAATTSASVPTETAVSATLSIIETNTPTASNNLQNPLPNFADLQQQMYSLINQARVEQGLSQLAWDTTATLAGQRHAEDMAQFNYFSHWNRDGLGPDHRYTLIGGQHAVMENLHAFSHTYDDGRATPIENWPEVIQNAHTGLMNSPGHRANILDPAHTHVGIGMAYNPQTGQFRLAQEFTNQYTRLEQPLPRQAQPADTLTVRGQFIGNNLSNPLLQLAYEPFPQPMSLEELERASTYSSAAVDVETRRIQVTFDEVIVLSHVQPGLYHLRLFVDVEGQQALVLDHVIEIN